MWLAHQVRLSSSSLLSRGKDVDHRLSQGSATQDGKIQHRFIDRHHAAE